MSLHSGSWLVPFAGTARLLYDHLRIAAGCPISGVVIAEITGEYLRN